MESKQKCMRCQEEVTIDFQESVSSSGKPMLIGNCPKCNGVNVKRLPWGNTDGDGNQSTIPETDQEITDDIPEGSQDSPAQDSSPSDPSEEFADIVHIYEQGYADGYDDGSSDISEQPEEDEEDNTTIEEEPAKISTDISEETEEEEDTDEKKSSFTPIIVIVATMIIAVIIGLWLASEKS